jgi:hypothetical protein
MISTDRGLVPTAENLIAGFSCAREVNAHSLAEEAKILIYSRAVWPENGRCMACLLPSIRIPIKQSKEENS